MYLLVINFAYRQSTVFTSPNNDAEKINRCKTFWRKTLTIKYFLHYYQTLYKNKTKNLVLQIVENKFC